MLGLRTNGIEGDNVSLDTTSEKLCYILLILVLVALALLTPKENTP